MKLLDVNLLVYAVNQHSPLHQRAKVWLERTLSGAEQVAFPWVVILGFLRVSTLPGAFDRRALTVAHATKVVDAWLNHPNVLTLSPGERHWAVLSALLSEAGTAGNLTSDAHLAALAIEHEAELCSSDSDFARFPGLRWTNPLALPPTRGRRG